MITVNCVVNGKPVSVEVNEGETLLDMVRDRLGLTGAKRGCEVGECGACTMLIDGVPTDTCLLLAPLVEGKEILTIEGVDADAALKVIQQAFVDEGAVQCGYCTPGMILSAHALIKKHGKPTLEQIKSGMSGNLCRCAAYQQIVNAVQTAAEKL